MSDWNCALKFSYENMSRTYLYITYEIFPVSAGANIATSGALCLVWNFRALYTETVFT